MSDNTGMAPLWTMELAKDLGTDGEAQRFSKTALVNIAATLSDMTVEQAEGLRKEYCAKFGKAKVEADKMKSRGTDDSMMTTAKWPADLVPPLLREFNMAADLVYKLRKLGVLAQETKIPCRFEAVKAKHAETYAGRAGQ